MIRLSKTAHSSHMGRLSVSDSALVHLETNHSTFDMSVLELSQELRE